MSREPTERVKRSTQKVCSDDEDAAEVLSAYIERRVLELMTELLTETVEERLHRYDFLATAKAVEEAVQDYWWRSER